jgi:cell division protein FtsB
MKIQKFDSIVTIACLTMLGYFAWHGLEGPRGFSYHDKINQEAEQLAAQLNEINSMRTKFEQRVALMRPEAVDPDLLDELARSTLEMAAPNELIMLRQQ